MQIEELVKKSVTLFYTYRPYSYILGVYIIVFLLLYIVTFRYRKITKLYYRSKKYSPEDFFAFRRISMKEKKKNNNPGVYVFHNKSKRRYYVGQSEKLVSRVNSHLTGKGNGDVYADYIYGDRISVKLIYLKRSGYHNLNKMEKDFIKYFKAYDKGYNKTKGNK